MSGPESVHYWTAPEPLFRRAQLAAREAGMPVADWVGMIVQNCVNGKAAFEACAICGSPDLGRQVILPFSVCPSHEYP